MLRRSNSRLQPAGGFPEKEAVNVFKPRNFPSFNGLRAIAATAVVVVHVSNNTGFTTRSGLGTYLGRLEIGVPIFFLISGFLLYRPFAVSHLNFSESPSTRRFWERRLLRIIPAYWLALTLLAYVFHLIYLGQGWQGPVANYFFLQIYFPKTSVTGIFPAWSLCVEMSFYLMLPIYASIIRSKNRTQRSQLNKELIGLLILVLISLTYRWVVFNLPIYTNISGHVVARCYPNCDTRPLWESIFGIWIPARLDLFALGMLLALLSAWTEIRQIALHFLDSKFMPWLSWLLASSAFFWACHLGIPIGGWDITAPITNIYKQSLFGISAFLVLLPAVFGPQDQGLIRKLLRSWPIASIGVISYGIYLWHSQVEEWLIFHHLGNFGDGPFIWTLTLTILITLVVTSLSYFVLEKPILRYKDHLLWWNRTPQNSEKVATDEPG